MFIFLQFYLNSKRHTDNIFSMAEDRGKNVWISEDLHRKLRQGALNRDMKLRDFLDLVVSRGLNGKGTPCGLSELVKVAK